MLESLEGYLKKKAQQLGMDRADRLTEIQTYLDAKFPGKCHAVSLNDGVLKLTTTSSSVASEIHYRYRGYMMKHYGLKKLVIGQI